MRRTTFVFFLMLGMAFGYSLGAYAAKGRDAPGTTMVMPLHLPDVYQVAVPFKFNALAFDFMLCSKPIELPAMEHRRWVNVYLPLLNYISRKPEIVEYSFQYSKINSRDNDEKA